MRTALICLLALFSFNSLFSQELSNDTDLYLAVNGKKYVNEEKGVEIEFMNGYLNLQGNIAYFNLDYTVFSKTRGVIKGESMNDPDGKIRMYYSAITGCITNEGYKFCPE